MSNAESQKRVFWKVEAIVDGRKARARTMKRHSVPVMETDEKPTLEVVRERVIETVRDFVARGTPATIQVVRFDRYEEKRESGWVSLTYSPFGAENERHVVGWRV